MGPAPPKATSPKFLRVVPALDADDPQRGVHVLVDDLQNGLGRLLDAHPELLGDVSDGLPRGLLVHLQRATEGDAGRNAVQNDVGVGHGRGLAAAAVGGGSRVGAGALRAYLQGTARGDESYRAAPRADAVHVYGRGLELEVPELDVAPDRRLAVAAQRDVGRRAAHVEGQDVGDPDLTRQVRRAGDAAGWSRQGDLDRAVSHRLRAHGPAVGADDGERALELFLVDGPLEVPHVQHRTRLHRGVHDRGKGPLVLAVLLPDVGGDGDGEVRMSLPHDVPGAPLVHGVDVGVQEADGERLDAAVDQLVHRLAHLVLVQRFQHVAGGGNAFRDADGVGRVGGRVRFLEGHPAVERSRGPGAGQVQDLLVPLRG